MQKIKNLSSSITIVSFGFCNRVPVKFKLDIFTEINFLFY